MQSLQDTFTPVTIVRAWCHVTSARWRRFSEWRWLCLQCIVRTVIITITHLRLDEDHIIKDSCSKQGPQHLKASSSSHILSQKLRNCGRQQVAWTDYKINWRIINFHVQIIWINVVFLHRTSIAGVHIPKSNQSGSLAWKVSNTHTHIHTRIQAHKHTQTVNTESSIIP